MIVKYRTPLIDLLIFIDTNGNMAQLVEQLTVNQWVTGSSPVIPAICWCGSTVEQLTCNQQVVGSIPITSSKYGGFPERPKGADCKSVVTDFGGSNPPSSTNFINADVAELADAPDLGSGAYGVGVRLPSSAPI